MIQKSAFQLHGPSCIFRQPEKKMKKNGKKRADQELRLLHLANNLKLVANSIPDLPVCLQRACNENQKKNNSWPDHALYEGTLRLIFDCLQSQPAAT